MKTLKFLATFCLGALLFTGCEPGNNDDNGGNGNGNGNGGPKSLILVADKTTIYDNGFDAATFTLYYDGLILESGYDLYMGTEEEFIAGNQFVSNKQGSFTIWATYGTVISNEVTINVVPTPPAAPEAPKDTNPSKTNFKRRVLLTQITGTGCQYCPLMINAVHQAMTGAYGDDAILTVAHLWNDNDPAYLYDAQTLDNSLGANGAPYLFMDLNKNYDTNYSKSAIDKNIQARLDEVAVRGGIAVSSAYHAEENYIVLNATVKAKTTGEFRIGAWLLEDGIKATQTNPQGFAPAQGVDFNTHDDCIRLADSKYTSSNYTGYSIGTIEAGQTASREFAFKLKANGTGGATKWNHDNLKVIVFISTKEDTGTWCVNNVVSCPKDGSVDFEYEN